MWKIFHYLKSGFDLKSGEHKARCTEAQYGTCLMMPGSQAAAFEVKARKAAASRSAWSSFCLTCYHDFRIVGPPRHRWATVSGCCPRACFLWISAFEPLVWRGRSRHSENRKMHRRSQVGFPDIRGGRHKGRKPEQAVPYCDFSARVRSMLVAART